MNLREFVGQTRIYSLAAACAVTISLTAPQPALSAGVASADTMHENSMVPEPFRGSSAESDFSILYEDLDFVLRQIVLVTGRSDRSRPSQVRPAAGSRIVRGAKGRFSLEGNRVHFPALAKKENLALLTRIRTELEAVPGQLPLKLLKEEEQLAYWLNLYNVTLLEQVALIYPETRLKRQFLGKKSLWKKKLLAVAGVSLSLNDIQHRIILPKFQNPLVMYGMFQGFVGGPNIRNEAYTGESVYRQLKENADEFINSNRGMHANERLLRISHLYTVNEALFPDWNRDLRAHLTAYANQSYRDRIRKASRLSPKVTGYDIADIYNGVTSRGSAMSTNPAAFLGSIEAAPYGSTATGHFGAATFVATDGGALASMAMSKLQMASRDGGRFPIHVAQYLMKIDERNKKDREAEVSIEELDNAKKQDPAKSKSHDADLGLAIR